MANPNNLTGIGHPGDPEWQLPNLTLAEAHIRSELRGRFANTDNADFDAIVDATVVATMRSEAHRDAHEKANVSRLLLTPEERREYERLSRNPDYRGQAIHWLGQLADLALDSPEDEGGEDDIGFDLGGTLQFANWETTGPLDGGMRMLPRQLNEIDKNIRMKIYGPRRKDENLENLDIAIEFDERTLINYLLMPLFKMDARSGALFDYAILRRRRAVADVHIPGVSRPIEIYKDSNFGAIPSQMRPEERAGLYAAYEEHGYNTKLKKNSPGAMIVGGASERGITSEAGVTTDVVTIGAYFVMKMFKDGRSIAKSLAA